jgi:hypothetical protein
VHCVTAVVTDASGVPVSGVSVFFQVTGANPQPGGSQATDANGRAVFCYVGTNVGTDTITASHSSLSDTASATWVAAGAGDPSLGKTVKIGVVSGTIRFRVPDDRRFHVLGPSQLIPIGSSIDSTNGTVRLFAAKTGGGVQKAIFFDGRFSVHQSKRSTLTDLRLEGGNLASCRNGKVARRAGRRLWGHGKGRTRTSGNGGSGTVRGTFWLTEDRCNGTFFKVREGAIAVRDFALHRTVVLRKGEQYLARTG